jgi:hypothetical protein
MSVKNPAKKANETRQARKNFRDAYPMTWEMARDLLKGASPEDVAWQHDVSRGTVAAVLANLNRPGNFQCMANDCHF